MAKENEKKEHVFEVGFIGGLVKNLELAFDAMEQGISKNELFIDENKKVWDMVKKYHKEGLKALTPSHFVEVFGKEKGNHLYDTYQKVNENDHIRYVYEMKKRKQKTEFNAMMESIQNKMNGANTQEEIDAVRGELFESVMNFDTGEKRSYGVYEIIDEHFTYKGDVAPVKTGYDSIDEAIGQGMYRGFFTILAGESGNFKTTFAENIILNAILKNNYNVYFATMEMTKDKIVENFLAKLTESDIKQWRVFFFEEDEVVDKKELAKRIMFKINKHLEINDHSFAPKEMAREIVRASKRNFDLFVIDYFQHLSVDDDSEFNKASKILCQAIKKCSNMACLLLSQVTENAPGKAKDPKEARLRMAKNLQNDTALEMIVFRDENAGDHLDTEHLNVYLRKNRNGERHSLVRLPVIPSQGIIGEFEFSKAVILSKEEESEYNQACVNEAWKGYHEAVDAEFEKQQEEQSLKDEAFEELVAFSEEGNEKPKPKEIVKEVFTDHFGEGVTGEEEDQDLIEKIDILFDGINTKE
jgi:replicative DNA helicase